MARDATWADGEERESERRFHDTDNRLALEGEALGEQVLQNDDHYDNKTDRPAEFPFIGAMPMGEFGEVELRLVHKGILSIAGAGYNHFPDFSREGQWL